MEFQSDRRSQSTVIGVVVLFGFFILALSLYQAQVVPQQNAETEFDHFQEAKNEFTVLRTAISRAGQTDVAQYENFKLGTNYRQRLFTLNPPAPAGQLQTTQPYNLTIDGRVIQTRFLEYEDGYHELRVGSIWYDNSVVYLEGRTDAERVIIEDQNLVTDDGQLRVTALQNSIETSGVRRVPVEVYPVENPTLTDSDFTGELSVRIPTRLNGSYWDDEIPSTLWTSTSSAVDVSAYPDDDDVYALALTVNSADLKFNTVGINSGPEDIGESLKQNVGAAPENSGGNGEPGNGGNDGENGFTNGSQAACTRGTTAGSVNNGYRISVEFTNADSCDSITLTGFGLAYDANQNDFVFKLLSRAGEQGGNPDQRDPPDEEYEITSTDGGLLKSQDSQGYAIDGIARDLDRNLSVTSGATKQLTFGHFYDTQNPKGRDPTPIGNFRRVESPPPDARYFTVKLRFADGTQQEIYLQVTDLDT